MLRAYVAPLPPGCPGPPRSEGLYVPLMKVRVHAAEEKRGEEGKERGGEERMRGGEMRGGERAGREDSVMEKSQGEAHRKI